jgi:2'-5' RNA ligase
LVRLFVAINLPSEVRHSLWTATEPLRALDVPVRWVGAESIHLTLKFLGDVETERERDVIDVVESTVAGAPRFVLPIGGFGMFPNATGPRVVWVGCEPVSGLELLQDRLERHMESVGFPVDGRPFRPHLTLGRVRRGTKRSAVRALGPKMGELSYGTETHVESVELMESELGKAGARYAVRHSVELAR